MSSVGSMFIRTTKVCLQMRRYWETVIHLQKVVAVTRLKSTAETLLPRDYGGLVSSKGKVRLDV